jgi:hypothetical protein
MTQYTSSVANRTELPQAVHAGLNYAFASFNSAAFANFSASVSDSIVMMKLPPRSRIVSAYIGGLTDDANGNMGFSLGDPGSNVRHGTQSISGTAIGCNWFTGLNANFAFSVSDDQTNYALTLHLQNVTSASGSTSVHLGVIWQKF